ncbi:hypothetical protein [Bradyrhizobium sp. DASA03007]|uniref:hypothetical protein n=1 Tax=unclassified Bradyrhizobium TaxID=2631580 RepID=UPI003F70D2E6
MSARVGTVIAVSVQEHSVVVAVLANAKNCGLVETLVLASSRHFAQLAARPQQPGRCGLVLAMLYQAHSSSMKRQEQQPRRLDPFTTDRESWKRPDTPIGHVTLTSRWHARRNISP